jgi:hypothetical protein
MTQCDRGTCRCPRHDLVKEGIERTLITREGQGGVRDEIRLVFNRRPLVHQEFDPLEPLLRETATARGQVEICSGRCRGEHPHEKSPPFHQQSLVFAKREITIKQGTQLQVISKPVKLL